MGNPLFINQNYKYTVYYYIKIKKSLPKSYLKM